MKNKESKENRHRWREFAIIIDDWCYRYSGELQEFQFSKKDCEVLE